MNKRTLSVKSFSSDQEMFVPLFIGTVSTFYDGTPHLHFNKRFTYVVEAMLYVGGVLVTIDSGFPHSVYTYGWVERQWCLGQHSSSGT